MAHIVSVVHPLIPPPSCVAIAVLVLLDNLGSLDIDIAYLSAMIYFVHICLLDLYYISILVSRISRNDVLRLSCLSVLLVHIVHTVHCASVFGCAGDAMLHRQGAIGKSRLPK